MESTTKDLTFFRLEGETLGEFAAQLKRLTPEEKDELAQGVRDYRAQIEAQQAA